VVYCLSFFVCGKKLYCTCYKKEILNKPHKRHIPAVGFLFICFCILFALSCQDRLSSKAKHSNPPTLLNELAVLFKTGTQVAMVTSDTGLTSKQKKVLQKFFRKLNSDPKLERDIESYTKLMETSHIISDSEALAWIQKTGFNREESIILASTFNHRQLYNEKDSVIISKDIDGIHFTGTGRISVLDSLVIYFNDSSASFKAEKLFQNDKCISLIHDFLPGDEHLEKYYCFEGPGGITGLLPIGDHHYYLTVGRLNKTSRTYIYLQLTHISGTDLPSNLFYSIIIE